MNAVLQYRIEIQGDANGKLWYNVSFQSGERNLEAEKFNSANVTYIHSTVEKLAEALRALPTPQT